jgi:two-component system, chemotaxis family, response regulator Rcp1
MISISTHMSEVQILLVEDNEGDILLTKEALKEGRVKNEISVARDGQQALQMLNTAETLPDLILLDINLPRVNGLEVLVAIKTDPRFKMIPVIMLSTSGAEHDIVTSYTNHANCFITKPVDFNRFMEVVRSIEDFWISIVKLPAKH